MTKIYTLLIGINDYQRSPLSGCIGDVGKMETYFNELNSSSDVDVVQKKLTDSKATKAGIVSELTRIIKSLKDNDTFVLYYSGHGTREISENRFFDDYNGVLECVVAYFSKDQTSGFLLADKEIRYLLNQCKVKAHILTIFDSCHSGDITRAADDSKQVKRMAYKFPQRPFSEFIFSDKYKESQFLKKPFSEIIPDQNILTISGCQAHEFSWEDSKGGVFTRNLLSTLDNCNNLINYNDLIKSIEISIRHTTKEKQAPTLSVQGSRKFNQLTSWLKLNGNQLKSEAGYITYNPKENMGWVYSKGKLMGVSKNNKIKLPINAEIKELDIKDVNLTDSVVDVPKNVLSKLDITKNYPVNSIDYLSPPRVHINNLDNNAVAANKLKTELKPKRSIQLVDSWEQSDFEINIFNNSVFFSFPNDPYRPLNRQLGTVKLSDYISKSLSSDLDVLKKWHHFNLQEKHEGFRSIPIKIEINSANNPNWIDITNGSMDLEAMKERSPDGRWYQEFEIRITNLTSDRLHITPLVLYKGKLEVSSYPFEEQSRPLDGSRSIVFNNFIALDYYQEVYNWDSETATFKIIVTSNEDLTQSIPSMIQSGFDEPITHLSLQRGGGLNLRMPNTGWGIYTAKSSIANPTFNKKTGVLANKLDWYKQNDRVWPFIEKLYTNAD